MAGSSLAGTVLSGRFKILKTIDVDSYKAHDLLLDQTVTVRQAIPASQRADDTWRQKVQHLTSVRDPNFLNILDVIYDKSTYLWLRSATWVNRLQNCSESDRVLIQKVL
jgi:hypothetical protein